MLALPNPYRRMPLWRRVPARQSREKVVKARRSPKATGVAPLAFLTDLRLGLARHRLAGAAASMDRIAAEAGYQSQAAFSRAFLRKYGVRPGKLRHDANALQARPDTQR
jgi:AraC family transcriptional regulator, activator of mtrCDE